MISAKGEGLAVAHRRAGAKFECCHCRFRLLAQDLVDQQRRQQRAMNDQPGIMLNLRRIGAVVVDAVGVEGDSRKTE